MARQPLFISIARELRQQIASGAYASGDRFSGDHELARRFEVSVVTVRQALTALVQEGLLTRRQGAGTFVAEQSSRPIAIYTEQNVFLPTTSRWHLHVMSGKQSQPCEKIMPVKWIEPAKKTQKAGVSQELIFLNGLFYFSRFTKEWWIQF